ncbi:MAG: enoyl-CoA hydratase/isomerase family protein [Proteobacteria bacterium]|nr:enoyl-CoA hydratase/isomerase family protein [Pseudomonadota bacterium]MBU1450835.1 enoyl-CoA hydratase/isomerase family protein [Pseudomonadota bacterium]MBU2470062.1 enoyl-CoA hydratase/isomerase family protein [Pseudomonadota bacterium]MBU2518450.1 enoyl-CoA hydratase/isomerase family protein [Pseudomonadota bacterium]
MSQPVLLVEDHGPVRLFTLNRPERLNALNQEMMASLRLALDEAAADDGVGAVVLTGAGRAFSAGADLAGFAQMAQEGDQARRVLFTGLEGPRALANFPKPLIAAVNGPAVGWGFTVSLMCDLRLASQEAYFSAAFVKVGVTPEFGSSFLLPAIVGLGRALELVLTARQMPAQEALGMGLLTSMTPPAELLPAALELAGRIAAMPRPAVGMAKALLRHGAEVGLEQVLDYEMRCFRTAMASPEHKAAVEAMLEAIQARKA